MNRKSVDGESIVVSPTSFLLEGAGYEAADPKLVYKFRRNDFATAIFVAASLVLFGPASAAFVFWLNLRENELPRFLFAEHSFNIAFFVSSFPVLAAGYLFLHAKRRPETRSFNDSLREMIVIIGYLLWAIGGLSAGFRLVDTVRQLFRAESGEGIGAVLLSSSLGPLALEVASYILIFAFIYYLMEAIQTNPVFITDKVQYFVNSVDRKQKELGAFGVSKDYRANGPGDQEKASGRISAVFARLEGASYTAIDGINMVLTFAVWTLTAFFLVTFFGHSWQLMFGLVPLIIGAVTVLVRNTIYYEIAKSTANRQDEDGYDLIPRPSRWFLAFARISFLFFFFALGLATVANLETSQKIIAVLFSVLTTIVLWQVLRARTRWIRTCDKGMEDLLVRYPHRPSFRALKDHFRKVSARRGSVGTWTVSAFVFQKMIELEKMKAKARIQFHDEGIRITNFGGYLSWIPSPEREPVTNQFNQNRQ